MENDTNATMRLLTFGEALEQMKKGRTVTRVGWKNPRISVSAQFPDENSKMTKPYLYMTKTYEDVSTVDIFPLDLSAESIFAEDWMILPN